MKESQETLEVGERDVAETEQIWTPGGVTLSSDSACAAATHPAPLHSDLALSLVSCLQRAAARLASHTAHSSHPHTQKPR